MLTEFLPGLGFDINGILNFTPAEAFKTIGSGAVLVDIREDYLTSLKTFNVSAYIICPLSSFDDNISTLPKDKPLIVADASGLKGSTAAAKLIANGYTNVANLAGGLVEWERDGFPVNKNPDEQLSGQCPCMLKPMGRVKK